MLEELAASGESDAGYSRRTGVASHIRLINSLVAAQKQRATAG